MLLKIIQGRNAIGFFLDEQAGRPANNHSIQVSRISLWVLGVVALAIGLSGCFGQGKIALMIQFDAKIGKNKDQLIKELGLPIQDCTPLQSGEACQWQQIEAPPFLEGPLEGTFPGDNLTYFLDSKGIVCQWRFHGARDGTQHSTSQC